MSLPRSPLRRIDAVDRYVALVTAIAVAAVAVLVVVESARSTGRVEWPAFALFTLLLLVAELEPRTWLTLRGEGIITMSWSFGFALLLLGSPVAAVGAMALVTLVSEVRAKKDVRKIVFNTAQVTMTLGFGGLALYAFGVNESIVSRHAIPLSWGAGVLASALVVFILNGAVVCLLLSVVHQASFTRIMRDGFAVSMTADGALLALAPIFVISVDFSWLMIPFLTAAALLVFRSAQHAVSHEHDALHDQLTGLANRRAFIGEAESVLGAGGDGHGIMLIDLNGFKSVNDRLGHEVGDAVLVEFASRLETVLDDAIVIARLGGDEFAVLVGDAERRFAFALLQDIHRTLTNPMSMDGFVVTVGASIGAAMQGADGSNCSELLHSADLAMYRAKHSSGTVATGESGAKDASRHRRRLLSGLGEIQNHNQLLVEFQPIVEFNSGNMTDLEACVRWNHPELGVLKPSEFMTVADRTGAIAGIMNFVLESALRELVASDDEGLSVSMSLSPGILKHESFFESTLRLLNGHLINPGRLTLEVPETAIVSDSEDLLLGLDRLRRSGVRLAIGKFGVTGSSLAMLPSMRVDRIRLDPGIVQSALSDHRSAVVVDGLVDVAHRLDIEVVADGIDDAATWNALHAMGCDLGQGDHIAPPAAIEDVLLARDDIALTIAAREAVGR